MKALEKNPNRPGPLLDRAATAEPSEPIDVGALPSRWWGWAPGSQPSWPDADTVARFVAYLEKHVGAGQKLPVPDPAGLALVPSRLPSTVVRALRYLLGPSRFSQAPHERLLHSLGQSFSDLVRRRRLDFGYPPDAVVYPETAEEIQFIVQVAAAHGVAVIPYGGGTSVVGGVEPDRSATRSPTITLNLRHLNRVLAIDEQSRLARVQAGIRGPDLEQALAAAEFTLGHFPQSFEFSTLGGWIATRSWGQASTRYGSIAQLVRGVKLAGPQGLLECRPHAGRSVGPELQELVLGSEGALGVIVEATLRISRRPEAAEHEAYLLPDFEKGRRAVRAMMQAGLTPALCRLSDTAELRASRVMDTTEEGAGPGGWLSGLSRWWLRAQGSLGRDSVLLLLGFEGNARRVEFDMRQARAIMRRFNGASLGAGPVRRWLKNRFRLPYLRDPLLEAGYLIETFETGATWDRLPQVYERGRAEIQQALGRGLVLCHLSHPTTEGACLYYTAMAPLEAGQEIEQWRRVKQAATEAFLEAGGSLSHHHGVGLDHRPWLKAEIGPAGIDLLRAIKRQLDPANVMNPGKLISPSE